MTFLSSIISAERPAKFGKAACNAPALALGDVVAFFLAFGVSGTIGLLLGDFLSAYPHAGDQTAAIVGRIVHVSIILGGVLLWFNQQGHYLQRIPFWTELKQILAAMAVAALVDGFARYLLQEQFSRLWMVLNWFLAAGLIVGGRLLVKQALSRAGTWQLPTAVVGMEPAIGTALQAINSEPGLGYEVVGRIDLASGRMVRGNGSTRSIGAMALADVPAASLPKEADRPLRSLRSAYRDLGAQFVIVAADGTGIEAVQKVVNELHRVRMPFAVIPSMGGMSVLGLKAQSFFSHDVVLLSARNNLANPLSQFLKRAFDLIVSSALLLALSPFFLIVGRMIRRDGGPAFYSSRRIGRGGDVIGCWKFRTMVANADQVLADLIARDPAAKEEWETTFKLKDDPRITPIGHFLRRTSLDELPQLWNVFKGSMSLVGPRPILTDEVKEYGEDIEFYFQVTPGITGLWQVSGRNEVDYRRRITLNTWYVKNWSLWHDITILFKTVKVVLKREGAY